MEDAAPIVESNSGDFEFLYGTGLAAAPPHTSSRAEPFPDADNLERVLASRRVMTDPWERYGLGRTANNLAAVYICTGRLQAAYDLTVEADTNFLGMFRDANPYPGSLTLLGLAASKYHASLLFRLQGEPGLEGSERMRTNALTLLSQNEQLFHNPEGFPGPEPSSRKQFEFLKSALIALEEMGTG